MKLEISQAVSDKIRWWLSQTNTEWSGIAFYSIQQVNSHGFPKIIRLESFTVLDIGSTEHTVFSAEEEAIADFNAMKNNNDDIIYHKGLIHSHNSMKAYFSGEDKSTIIKKIPNEGFFLSLVVSSHLDENRAFAMAYRDQWHNPCILYNIDIQEPVTSIIPKADWVSTFTRLDKKAQKANKLKISNIKKYERTSPHDIWKQQQIADYPRQNPFSMHQNCDDHTSDYPDYEDERDTPMWSSTYQNRIWADDVTGEIYELKTIRNPTPEQIERAING